MTTAALALLALLLLVSEPADTGARGTLITHGASVALSKLERSQIARRVETLMVGCAMTSVTFPGLFAARSLPKEWDDARAGSHLYVRFPKPLVARRGRLRISEVVIGLQDPNFIGPELSRHADQVVGHGKCDGHRALALACASAVRPHLLPRQRAGCEAYDRIGEPREQE